MNKKEIEITTNMLNQFAEDLMFKLNPEQLQNLLLEFKAIAQQMKIVTTIDTSNIEPLHYPLAIVNTTLRLDSIAEPLTSKSVLNLAPQVDNGYIVINQVINHEN